MEQTKLDSTTIEDRVSEAFNPTIFWNCLTPYPEKRHEEELPLVVYDPAPPAYCDDEERKPILVRFVNAENDLDVAVFPWHYEEDGGQQRETANFVANLPVYIPALLARIAELKSELATARPA